MLTKNEFLHSIIVKEGLGYQCDANSLLTYVESEGREDISIGSISGFLNRAVSKGMMKVAGRRSGRQLYETIDTNIIWNFRAESKDTSSLTLKLSEKLNEIAIEIEKLENKVLSSVSTEDLMKELKKRMK